MCKKMSVGATPPGRFVLALVCAMLVLPGSVLANPPDENGNHSHGGGGGGTIPVTATFRDFQGDNLEPVPDRMMSDFHDCPTTGDCLSPYIDGVDKVGAGISTRGNFRMTLTKGNQSPIRTIFFDFSDCIEGPCEPSFTFGFSTGQTNMFTSGSGIDLKEMFVGEVRDDLTLGMALDLTSVDLGVWELFFDPSNARCSGSNYISVTRVDADTWEIEAGIDDVVCLAKLGGGGEFIFSGLYRMPFKIIVQK